MSHVNPNSARSRVLRHFAEQRTAGVTELSNKSVKQALPDINGTEVTRCIARLSDALMLRRLGHGVHEITSAGMTTAGAEPVVPKTKEEQREAAKARYHAQKAAQQAASQCVDDALTADSGVEVIRWRSKTGVARNHAVVIEPRVLRLWGVPVRPVRGTSPAGVMA